ncbi:MAG: VPLPA-CTERM sorting domain-containing protein [Desulfobulbus sp.]|jgi:hypothetical protein
MKKVYLCSTMVLLLMSGIAHADLTTIGTATYNGADYKLIWDDDNNGNSVVWLDYSNAKATWDDQIAWASSLNQANALTYNINPAYTVQWGTNSWRLPATVDQPFLNGYDGTTTGGYNVTSSEMGHLYYTELGNLGMKDTSGNNQSEYGLKNTGSFDNLVADSWYWSATEHNHDPFYDKVWSFNMQRGHQSIHRFKNSYGHGLAIRDAQVSAVPVPGAIWLVGAGVIALSGLGRRRAA